MNTFASLNSSQRIFNSLLVLYPREYREEFGPHMSQLFKDCSREALALRGTTGLITLWLATLPDLFKTAFEENFKEITHMSKEKFHRLGKWAFAMGAFVFWVFAIVALSNVGNPGDWKYYAQLAIGPLSMLLFAVGVLALRSQYGQAAGGFAKTAMASSALGAIASALGAIGLVISEWAWTVFISGAEVMLLGIGLFGVFCLRRKILPELSWLLAFSGISLPLMTVANIIADQISNRDNTIPWSLNQLVMSLGLLALLAAGLLLQGAQEPAPRAAKR